MSLCQRSATRFFAVFHRWNCYTQSTAQCPHVTLHGRIGSLRSISHPIIRGYVKSTTILQDKDVAAQTREQDAPSTLEPPVDGGQKLEEKIIEGQSVGGRENAIHERQDYNSASELEDISSRALPDGVRALMRHVPSSVAIITAAYIDPETKLPAPLGTAISSLNTVTLAPPHVSFNIKTPSTTLDAIRAAKGLFRVHFLSCREKSGQIVENFTRGNHAGAFKLRRRLTPMSLPTSRDLPEATDSLAPQIRDSAVVAAMECELTQEIPVADHVIAVAKVKSLECRPQLESTLLYHDGKYKRNNGTVIREHKTSQTYESTVNEESGIYWNYPLFPGEAEKQDFKQRLKEHIRNDPSVVDTEPFQYSKKLQASFGIPSGAFGISLWHLVAECRKELGVNPGLTGLAEDIPTEADFYSRLTPSHIASIVRRAKQLVYSNPQSLTIHWKQFFGILGVHPVSTGLLAGDILEPLRAEGLVSPFELRLQSRSMDNNFVPTIEDLEDIEVKLLQFFKTVSYDDAHRMHADELERAIGEKGWTDTYIKRIRTRITTEAYSVDFLLQNIDISGEVTPEEARVIVSRVIDFLSMDGYRNIRSNLKLPKTELLRRIRVHPMVSGIDLDFLFGKLMYNLHRATRLREFSKAVDDMWQPLFTNRTFTWEELKLCTRKLIQSHLGQVLRWSHKDILAAMGIDPRAKISLSPSTHSSPILRNHLLATILARELNAYAVHATPQEAEAIAAYLKTTHGYDMSTPEYSSIKQLAHENDDRKDSDEQRSDTMSGINALGDDRAKQELEEAMKQFNIRPTIQTRGSNKKYIKENRGGFDAGRSSRRPKTAKRSGDAQIWRVYG